MDKLKEAAKLQKEGKYAEALDILDQELLLTQQQYGEHSPAVHKLEYRVAELCNQLAMNCLVNENLNSALDLLKRAQILSTNSPHLKVITYNNLACFYRRQGKLRVAMNYLHKALEIDSSPDIYLNLCAVLSQSGKHDLALEQAMHAVILLQEVFINAAPSQQKEAYTLKAPVLAIAYHNLAVELEHLKRLPESLRYYNKAVDFARTHLPDDHTVMIALLEAQINASRQAKYARNSRYKQVPPIRGNYRIVFREGKDIKTSRSPSPLAHRYIRSKSPEFGKTATSVSPIRNQYFEPSGAFTERLKIDEVINTETDYRPLTLESVNASNFNTPKIIKFEESESLSTAKPQKMHRKAKLAQLRHSIQIADDMVNISSNVIKPMLEISPGKIVAIPVKYHKSSTMYSTDTLSIEPKRKTSDSENSELSRKKHYTRDALDIINQFGISINSYDTTEKKSHLVSDNAHQTSLTPKESNSSLGNEALDPRISFKDRIASLKSGNSSVNDSMKTDRSAILPPLPIEEGLDLDTVSAKAPSQTSRLSFNNSQNSVKVFKRSITRSSRASIHNRLSEMESQDGSVLIHSGDNTTFTHNRPFMNETTLSDNESLIFRKDNTYDSFEVKSNHHKEENLSDLDEKGTQNNSKRGNESIQENLEEETSMERREIRGSMIMKGNYDDIEVIKRENMFKCDLVPDKYETKPLENIEEYQHDTKTEGEEHNPVIDIEYEPNPVIEQEDESNSVIDLEYEPISVIEQKNESYAIIEQEDESNSVIDLEYEPISVIEQKNESYAIIEQEDETKPVIEQEYEPFSVIDPKNESYTIIEEEDETNSVIEQEYEPISVIEQEDETNPVINLKYEAISVIEPKNESYTVNEGVLEQENIEINPKEDETKSEDNALIHKEADSEQTELEFIYEKDQIIPEESIMKQAEIDIFTEKADESIEQAHQEIKSQVEDSEVDESLPEEQQEIHLLQEDSQEFQILPQDPHPRPDLSLLEPLVLLPLLAIHSDSPSPSGSESSSIPIPTELISHSKSLESKIPIQAFIPAYLLQSISDYRSFDLMFENII